MNSCFNINDKLKETSQFNTYIDNQIKDCVLNEMVKLNTPFGVLIPQYEHAEVRRKRTYSVSFFQNGNLSRIALNEQTIVETPIGMLPAELITFYENGNIKRLFPLNGQISAYWDEDDEYNLAEELSFNFPFGSFRAKIIGIGFYENGRVKSITLWPKEIILIGEQRVRIGLSLYPNGNIKSFEPAKPINVITPIGPVSSYDTNAIGITGDNNSLCFSEAGTIQSLITSSSKIIVTGQNNITNVHSPTHIGAMYEDEIYFQPLKIDFYKDKVLFNGQDEYKIEESRFTVEPYINPLKNKCSDCSSCRKCSSNPS